MAQAIPLQQMHVTDRLLRPAAVCAKLGVSTTTLWRLTRTDLTFPPKVRLGERAVGYSQSALDTWVDSRRVAAAA